MRTFPLLLVSALLLTSCGSNNDAKVTVEKTTKDTPVVQTPAARTPEPPPSTVNPAPATSTDTARLNAMQREIDRLKKQTDDKTPPPATGGSSSERVKFEAGRSAATINGTVNVGMQKEYILGARAGQTLMARIDSRSGGAILSITGPDGRMLLQNGTTYDGSLEADGDYRIRVTTGEKVTTPASFSLYTEIK